jgi:hypothetical protein
MSNPQAIAAVTATLQSILQTGIVAQSDLYDTVVTIQPLDKARAAITANQLNLFLYMVMRNAAWANADMPRLVLPGELGKPPLPLNLYYLITAFGRDDDATQPFGHEVLGKAMSLLHDHPVLSATDIRNAVASILPDSDLDQQLDRVRITLHPLGIDELSKLFAGFAMQYRLSAAYEVGVTLIESALPTRTPIPVLTRGPGDQGFFAQASLAPILPTLTAVTPPNQQPSARLGDILTITGAQLGGTNIGVQFDHALWSAPVVIVPLATPAPTGTALSAQIPNQPAVWPAGFYTVAVLVQRPGETFQRSTNLLPMALAPSFTISPANTPAGAVTFTVTASPEVWPTQRAALLLNDTDVPAAALTAQDATLTFAAPTLAAGQYWARLRVDGVDSLLIDRTQTPPAFLASQQVTLT